MIVLRISPNTTRDGRSVLRWGIVSEDSLGRPMALSGGVVEDSGLGREHIYDSLTAALNEDAREEG